MELDRSQSSRCFDAGLGNEGPLTTAVIRSRYAAVQPVSPMNRRRTQSVVQSEAKNLADGRVARVALGTDFLSASRMLHSVQLDKCGKGKAVRGNAEAVACSAAFRTRCRARDRSSPDQLALASGTMGSQWMRAAPRMVPVA